MRVGAVAEHRAVQDIFPARSVVLRVEPALAPDRGGAISLTVACSVSVGGQRRSRDHFTASCAKPLPLVADDDGLAWLNFERNASRSVKLSWKTVDALQQLDGWGSFEGPGLFPAVREIEARTRRPQSE